jgi:toxin FitB
MFLLDTNVISELRKSKSGTANAGVTDWAVGLPVHLIFMSVISLHELEQGVLLAERKDPAKGALLREWLTDSVCPGFADRTIAVTGPIAVRAAALHVPDPAPFRDALIGATAIHHGMTVVTRNVRDFERFTELEVVNPWSS